MLSVAQIVYNISINVTTEQISFFINHRYNINLFLKLKKVTFLINKAQITADKIIKMHKELQKNIEFLSHCSAFYYNQHYAGAPTLKKRDKVYLLQRNIKKTRSSNKLNHVKIRPFKIIRNIKRISFKLDLLESM